MLVLTRKLEETIRIGSDILVKVIRLDRNEVKLGIEAPSHVRILRGELALAPASVQHGLRESCVGVSNGMALSSVETERPNSVVPVTTHKFLMDYESGYLADLEDQLLVSAAS